MVFSIIIITISVQQHICRVQYMLLPVCPSVCTSICHTGNQSKTVKVTIMQLSPYNSLIPLVFGVSFIRNSDRFPLNRGVKQRWGGKTTQTSTSYFLALCINISKTRHIND